MLALLIFASAVFAQPPHHCDDLHELIEKNAQYGKEGVFNTTYFPDAFKDLVGLHIPTVTLDGNEGAAVMSTHPQGADHWITDIWVYSNHGQLLDCRKFNSSEKAQMHFRVPTHTGYLRVFEHCNLHGVWEAPAIELRCHDLRRAIANNSQYGKDGIFNSTYYPDAFKGLVGLHVPVVTISADMTTGKATLATHPMVEAHHITDIWILDQHGEQIACETLLADDTAAISFNIPEHVTEIYAIEHCNLHGVWMADPVNMTELRESAAVAQ